MPTFALVVYFVKDLRSQAKRSFEWISSVGLAKNRLPCQRALTSLARCIWISPKSDKESVKSADIDAFCEAGKNRGRFDLTYSQVEFVVQLNHIHGCEISPHATYNLRTSTEVYILLYRIQRRIESQRITCPSDFAFEVVRGASSRDQCIQMGIQHAENLPFEHLHLHNDTFTKPTPDFEFVLAFQSYPNIWHITVLAMTWVTAADSLNRQTMSI